MDPKVGEMESKSGALVDQTTDRGNYLTDKNYKPHKIKVEEQTDAQPAAIITNDNFSFPHQHANAQIAATARKEESIPREIMELDHQEASNQGSSPQNRSHEYKIKMNNSFDEENID